MKKIMLVTGGSRGIGAATARLAAADNYAVAISYLHQPQAAASVVDAIRAEGGEAMAVQADVSLEADVLRLFAEVDEKLGRITALVNNAGMLAQQMRVEQMDAGRINRILAVNVTGSFLCAREAVRRMSTRHGGQGGGIVNLSSRAAQLGAPGEYVDYAASKAAVKTLTKGLALEVAAEGIRVNAVSPGLIETDIHVSGGEPGRVARLAAGVPMQRGGSPEEVARAILWLLSAQASFTTGAVLEVSGGR